MDLGKLMEEVNNYVETIQVGEDGEHLWDNYQEVVAISLRLQTIHNDIAYEEILGQADSELKRFRTMIVDPTIERFDKLAAFESRKITARAIEAQLDR